MRRKATRANTAKVLTESLQFGLSATVYLMRERVTDATRHLYYGGRGCRGAREIWRRARADFVESKREGRPNAEHLQRAEHSIRRSYNRLLLNTSVRYGNTEEKRKRRREDRAYINTLADYLGARLRDVGAEQFPFPPPAKNISDDGKIQWVYPGNARTPEYVPRHTASEQDFMDMIRSHGLELVRQCFKYNVPMADARRYIDDLIMRLTPFLESVYTGRRSRNNGGQAFVHGASRELRNVVHALQVHHGTSNGWPQSITSGVLESLAEREQSRDIDDLQNQDEEQHDTDTVSDSEPPFPEEVSNEEQDDFDGFFSHLADECDVSTNPEWRRPVEKLRRLVEQGILTSEDAKHLRDVLVEDTRSMGASFHDFIANADITHRPFSLSAVVRHGDSMLSEPSEFRLASEVPIANGRGRADLILFRRRVLNHADDSRPDVVWEPCVLIDVKTKCVFDLDLYAVPTKSRDAPRRRVVEFDTERRRMTGPEWEEAVSSTPTEYEREQLATYEAHILSEYQRIARVETGPSGGMMKAVLVVDSKENWDLVRENIWDLIIGAHGAPQKGSAPEREAFQLKHHGEDVHAALVVLTRCEDAETTPPVQKERFDPFRYSRDRNDSREFVLYLTASGKGSSQESAAKIAAMWHGLSYVYQRAKGKHRDVVWLDFAGEYSSPTLREQRLRMRLQPKPIVSFLKERVSFVDLSESTQAFLHGGPSLSSVLERAAYELQSARRPLIAVTGFEALRRQTPSQDRARLDEFITGVIKTVPEESTVIWFDRPVPLDRTSQRFDMRCVGPFYGGSPWKHVVDEIVWNLPMCPQRSGSHVPARDDIRLVVVEKPGSIDTAPILISPLYMWGERFRADKNREENIPAQSSFFLRRAYSGAEYGHSRVIEQEDIEAALELVPHLLQSMPNGTALEPIGIDRHGLSVRPAMPQSLMSRVSFVPNQVKPTRDEDGRVKRLEPLENINHRREYRTTRLYVKYPKRSTKPPHLALLRPGRTEWNEIARRELQGLRKTINVLRRRYKRHKSLDNFLNLLSTQIGQGNHAGQDSAVLFETLRSVRALLETHDLSRGVWQMLKAARSWCPNDLNRDQREHLIGMLDRHPDFLLLVGNDLFLLLLVAIREADIAGPSTAFVEKLWKYLVPWQLVSLGFVPHYHVRHRTGESVYQRTRVMSTLITQCRIAREMLDSNQVRETLFGRCIPVFSPDQDMLLALWLVFQTRLGSHDMNVSLVPMSGAGKSSVVDALRVLPREKPYWGETSAVELSSMARGIRPETGVPIAVGRYHGVKGLWLLDTTDKTWSQVGRIDYSTRQDGPVTLLQSFTLREDSSLVPIDMRDMGSEPEELGDLVETAIGYVDAVFRECQLAKCHVTIDDRKSEFHLSFYTRECEVSQKLGSLSTARTADVLEILRRPDFDCEPVIVNGRRLVWNRFRDIEYVGDASLLRPWVERLKPFKSLKLGVPEDVQAFRTARRRSGVRLHVVHEAGFCPLTVLPVNEIEQRQNEHSSDLKDYLRRLEGSAGQPDHLLTESVYRHGACWRVKFESSDHLPKAVTDLEEFLLGGPAVAALLRSGALMYQDGTRWIVDGFNVPDAKNLPPEFVESLHLVEAYHEVIPEVLKTVALPGAHLALREEMWTVSLRLHRDHIIWAAKSDQTSRYLHDTTFTIPLPKQGSLEYVNEYVMENIAGVLPESRIRNMEQVRNNVISILEELGHRRKRSDSQEAEPSEPAAPLPADIISEYDALQSKVENQIADGEIEDALQTLDALVAMLEPWAENTLARPYLIESLITKVEILTSHGKATGTSPESLLCTLDRVNDLVREIETRVVTGRSPFAKRVRWALGLREALGKRTSSDCR